MKLKELPEVLALGKFRRSEIDGYQLRKAGGTDLSTSSR